MRVQALPEAHAAFASVLRAMASQLFSAPGDEVRTWHRSDFDGTVEYEGFVGSKFERNVTKFAALKVLKLIA